MATGKKFGKRLAGFRPIATAFTIFSLLNIAVYLLIQLHPPLLDSLYLSADHPWGIVTSAFTHAELDHLANNLQGFVLSVVLFVPVVSVYTVRTRRRWSRVFLWLAFAAGFLANMMEYPLLLRGADSRSWGASGIVYGALGVLLAASLSSLPAHLKALPRKRRKRRFRFNRMSWVGFRSTLVMSLLLALMWQILTDPAEFLSAGPGVDVMAHGIGFLIGLVGGVVAFRSGIPAQAVKPRKRG